MAAERRLSVDHPGRAVVDRAHATRSAAAPAGAVEGRIAHRADPPRMRGAASRGVDVGSRRRVRSTSRNVAPSGASRRVRSPFGATVLRANELARNSVPGPRRRRVHRTRREGLGADPALRVRQRAQAPSHAVLAWFLRAGAAPGTPRAPWSPVHRDPRPPTRTTHRHEQLRPQRHEVLPLLQRLRPLPAEPRHGLLRGVRRRGAAALRGGLVRLPGQDGGAQEQGGRPRKGAGRRGRRAAA